MSGSKPRWDAQTKVSVATFVAAIAGAVVPLSQRWAVVAVTPDFLGYIVAGVSLFLIGLFLVRDGLAPVEDEYEFYDTSRSRWGAFVRVVGGGALVALPILGLVFWLMLS